MFKQGYELSIGGKICAQLWCKFWHPAEYIQKFVTPKNVKNWQEKQEKVGKIIFMDFTARSKSCSTKTKFDNLFKTNRNVAQDSWARFATFWGILSFKLKKLYANYHALSKVFVEWLPTTATTYWKWLCLSDFFQPPEGVFSSFFSCFCR